MTIGRHKDGGVALKYALIVPPKLHIKAVPFWKLTLFHFKIPSDSCQVVESGLWGLDGTKSCDTIPIAVE